MDANTPEQQLDRFIVMDQALRVADPPIDVASTSRIIIKSAPVKRRPRRPAPK